MQVVILCGGKGTRLHPYTLCKPKALIEINGKPFLSYQLEMLYNNGYSNIVLCTGNYGEQISEYIKSNDYDIKISHEDHLLGTCGALYNARNLLDDEFWVIYGDSFLLTNLSVIRYESPITMTIYRNTNPLHINNIIINEVSYIDYGFIGMNKSILEPNCDLKDVINKYKVNYVVVNEPFYEIGTPERLNEFKRYINDR